MRKVFLTNVESLPDFREILEFNVEVAVKKNIWNVTLEIWGQNISLFVTGEEELSVIYFHQHTFAKWCFFLFFCL